MRMDHVSILFLGVVMILSCDDSEPKSQIVS